MSLVTRIITNTGAPLYRPNGDIASDVRITFELVNPSGMTVDAWDAETGKRVGSKSVAVTTDAGGEFSVALWPNSRGSEPTKYLCTVHSSGYRPFSGVIEDVPQPLPWAAFMAHGTPLTPQELSQLGQYLDEIEQAKDAAEAAAAGATGAVGAALDAHIAAADPHSQYAKDTDLDAHTGDTDNPHGVTPAQIGADPAGAAAGAVSAHEGAPDPHPQYATAGELGAALDGKVDKVVGMGLSAEDYSAADKIKLSGIEVGAQVNVVTSVAGKTGAVELAKADVGLSNADNTSDADKPVSTATATALAGKVDASDPRLSDAREWTAATVDQAEAEAGTATTRKAWTAQRVRQAMLGWWGGFAAKTTPVDADSIVIADSAASNAPKRLSWANAVAKLRGTFVEGPASAVDGQVMVFSGASGKLARGIGKSDAEFGALYPSFNLIKANGTFGTMVSDGTVATSSFSAPVAGPLAPANGATWSAGEEFKYFETPRLTLFQDFAPKISLGNMLCRAAKLTAGAGSGGGFTHTDGKVYAGGTVLGMSPAYPINGSTSSRLTFAVWVRAIDEDMIFWWRSGDSPIITRDSLPVASNSVQVVTPDDKWVHFCISSRLFYSISSYSPICLQSGKSAYFMLPILVAADVRIPMHNIPCATYTTY